MEMIKLISLNVERSKHLDRILPFLAREKPDVLCVMELAERDIPRFEASVGACHAFAPMMMHHGDGKSADPVLVGNGIFSRLSGTTEVVYYRGSESGARALPAKDVMEDISLIRFDCEKDGAQYRIITTHFTWTPDGQSSAQQFIDIKALFEYLDRCNEFVLCGDFNAPRGGEIFSLLSARYTDNIPAEYAGSIDVSLHRAGHLKSEKMELKMVDGLFTTSRYRADDVHLVDKVSDHMAIVAQVQSV